MLTDEEKLEKEILRITDDIYDAGVEFNGYEDKSKQIIKLVRDSEWVSVEDELPENGQEILICRDLGERKLMQTEVYEGNLYWGREFNNVTYWKPISPPANKGANK